MLKSKGLCGAAGARTLGMLARQGSGLTQTEFPFERRFAALNAVGERACPTAGCLGGEMRVGAEGGALAAPSQPSTRVPLAPAAGWAGG